MTIRAKMKQPMTLKKKIVVGCLSTVVFFILAVIIFIGIPIYSVIRSIKQAENYILTLSDADKQQWIARTETILNNNDYKIPVNYDDLPSRIEKPLTYYIGDDTVRYHWCAGIICADLTVNRLPEGVYEIVVLNRRQNPPAYITNLVQRTTGNNP